MLHNVVPHIAQCFPALFVLTLALPIIWACYDEQLTIPVPDFLRNRVRQAYEQIRDPNNLPAQKNPIEKQQLVVINDNGALLINTAGRLANINNQQNDANGIVLQLEQELRNVHVQLAELSCSLSLVQANGQQNKEAWQRIAPLH